MSPQHRTRPSNIAAAELVAPGRVGHGGRHRAPSIDSQRMIAATVAAGAMLASGYQVIHPGVADATPVAPAPAPAPVPGPIEQLAQALPLQQFAQALQPPKVELPASLELPAEVQGVVDDVNQGFAQAAAPIVPQAQVVRPVDSGQITSGFGYRWGSMHSGLDFADPIGTPIRSVASGTVIEAGPASGFGQWVRVQHDDGTIGVYGHVNDILSSVGQRVNAGDVIATVGNLGWSTGPHLHLEIWQPDGTKVDPAPWLTDHGVALHWGDD